MGSHRDKFVGLHWDDEDHLLVRARAIRQASIEWLPPRREWPMLYSVLIKPPGSVSEKWLVVLKASTEDGYVVAFHKGSTLLVALSQALHRCFAGKIKWLPETPYNPPRG